jgi:protoheme IX farnesyltransferase
MLPVIEGDEETAWQIWLYSLILIPFTIVLTYPLHVNGVFYTGVALLLGGIFLQKAWKLLQAPSDRQVARSLFKFSIFYLMLLCAGMVVDVLPVTHQLLAIL